jgi:acyl-CoA synthetase (AMP-forming)/AMP-acid ligase II
MRRCSTHWRASAASSPAVPDSGAHRFVGPPLAAAVPAVSLPELIRAAGRRRGDAPALVDATSGRRIGFDELDQRVGALASGLAGAGLGPGQTLVLFAPNSPDWPIVALAAMAAGAAVSGANPQYGAEDLAHQMRDARATFVATTLSGLPVVRAALATGEAQGEAQGAARVVLIDGSAPDALSVQALCERGGGPLPDVAPQALAALPYSSGTTGLPKGVMLTHRTLVTNVAQVNQVLGLVPGDVVLAFLPMFHIYGFTAVTMCALAAGATVVTLPRFEPVSFLDAIERHRVTRLAVVPPVLQFLATHAAVDGRDLSSLSRITSGAAPLSAALEERVAQRIGRRVTQGYGMTESSGVIATTPHGQGRAGASGQLLPATEARVVDTATGLDAPPGEAGEIWFRGPQAFAGYLNQPEATAAMRTPDGWVRTGDIGRFDADGYLFITDRLKELIKVKGFQVAPAELEALLGQHPDVADVAVIGRPDERAGELPVAWVVPRSPTLTPAALQDWVAERVVAYKRIADVVLCQAIPKTAAGKILRRELRRLDRERDIGRDTGHDDVDKGT